MTVIEATGLAKSFGDVRAVADVSLAIDDGEVFGLLGPNGAGKTTTINLLTGQARPDAGACSVLGVDPADDPVGVRERIGILPERESPPSFLTPREYFDFVGDVRGIDDDALAGRVAAWADRLDLTDKLDTLNTDLSRGQAQKVMLVQAFLAEPAVVVIDEPLTNLDPLAQELIKDRLAAYADDGGTILLSTHDIGVAADICARVAIVHRGRVVAERALDGGATRDDLLALFRESTGA